MFGETRVEVFVSRLAGNFDHWKGMTEEAYRLDQDFLKRWKYIEDSRVSDIRPVACNLRDCVTFTVGGKFSCGAFTHWSGQLTDTNDTDLIDGYYCSSRSGTVSAETLNLIFTSIVIRGDDGNYVALTSKANVFGS